MMEEKAAPQFPNYWGNSPSNEQDYYSSQKIRSTSSYFSPNGNESLAVFTRAWLPLDPATPPRAVVFMIHGYGNDISWTFQATPIFLAQNGFACFALDLPGHGRSHGLKGFVPDLDSVIDGACIPYIKSIIEQYPQKGLKCFLYGESMGGAICLLIHLRQQLPLYGAILAAPMCKISDKIKPVWPIPQFLTFIAKFVPTLPIVPTADLIEKSVKVEEKRVVAVCNPMRYTGKPRLGTVLELLRVTDKLSRELLSEVTIPFLVIHGSADVVTDPEVSRELYEKARSEDKTLKVYDGMMHSLLFGETDENVELVRRDILDWLSARLVSDSYSDANVNADAPTTTSSRQE